MIDKSFEQYKLAVEMWDRVRARRQQSNSFYATINTALVTAIAAKDAVKVYVPYVCFAGITLCVLWFFYIMLYKNLIDIKQDSIIKIEDMLEQHPFRDEKLVIKNRFLSFTRIE